MKPLFKRIATVISVAALLGASAVTPAMADSRYRHHRHHGGNTGAYIGLGFGALALGALAYSASRPAYYYAPPAYYYPPPAPPPYPYSYYPYYSYAPPPGYAYDPYADTYRSSDPEFDRPSN